VDRRFKVKFVPGVLAIAVGFYLATTSAQAATVTLDFDPMAPTGA